MCFINYICGEVMLRITIVLMCFLVSGHVLAEPQGDIFKDENISKSGVYHKAAIIMKTKLLVPCMFRSNY